MNGFPYNRLLAIINLYASSLGDLSDLFGINLGHMPIIAIRIIQV